MNKPENNSVPIREDIVEISDVLSTPSETVSTRIHSAGSPHVNKQSKSTKTRSTVLEQSDTVIIEIDLHSAKCEQVAESEEYKITLAHARKIALNSVKQAKDRSIDSADVDD